MKNVITFSFIFLFTVLILLNDSFAQSFYSGKIGMNLSIYGRVRVYSDSLTTRQIDRSSILVASAPNAVFDYTNDAEAIDTAMSVLTPSISDYELYGSIDNSYAGLFAPPDVLAKINVYGWNNVGGAIVKFTIINRESFSIDATVGMEIIPQPNGSYGLETIKYYDSEKIISTFRQSEDNMVGYKILSGDVTTVHSIDWYDGYSLIDDSLYNWMTTGTFQPQFDAGGDGPVTFFSQNSVPVSVGDSTVVYIGISVGIDETGMLENMDEVQSLYDLITDVPQNINAQPTAFELNQNYPNPFNPSTTISFSIPSQEKVKLQVFNALGQEVALLLDKEISAGSYNYTFDASGLTSGIYFYTLSTGTNSITKKMILIK